MRNRGGFSLLAMLVTLAMIATIAIVTVPFLTLADRSQRVMETWEMLESVRLALYRTEPVADTIRSFRQRVAVNAGRLSQLTTPITSGNAANAMNSCGNQFLNPQVTNWRTHGPFGKFWIDSAVGMVTPIGIARDRMRRTPAGGGGGSGTLEILFINQVDSADVALLDEWNDGATGRTAGVIRWSTQATDGILDTVRYFMTIDGQC
jgi:type II secretory pathway pseudopilin PulG